jgi:hypothetical protein
VRKVFVAMHAVNGIHTVQRLAPVPIGLVKKTRKKNCAYVFLFAKKKKKK